MNRFWRTISVLACSGAMVASLTGASVSAAGEAEPPDVKAPDNVVYFVHGWGDAKDCGELWGNALGHFEKQGWDPRKLITIGYYKGDACDESVAQASREEKIQDIAAKLANHIYDKHKNDAKGVDVVAHSMGGLITRVAVLGSANGWDGFPDDGVGAKGVDLPIDDIVTLGTPHQGVTQKFGDSPDDEQWDQMDPEKNFIKELHRNMENERDIDWSFVGSNEDDTVTAESAIDKGFHADHKYIYRGGNELEVGHTEIRSEDRGDHHFNLRHWHKSDGQIRDTNEGRSPVALAYRAVTSKDR